ncbi:MAG: Ig-like domain-containing protein [Nitrosarchaeum sp.]|nr:Ig-like domain-containing protein [Nitrosarchaeum sp.]
MFIMPANAQTTAEFGYQLHPEKLLENTVGTLQIFVTSNEMMVPRSINDLKVISSDNSIIQVIGIQENNNEYTKNVQIKAIKPGITNIALAAPGFASKEITLQVFNNNNYPTQILMKITPDNFPIDGPRFGYATVELATTGGLPTIAPEDITIHVETPNKDIINIRNQELLIKKGEYFATTEFDLGNPGDAIIFASAENMKKVSQFVHISKPMEPLTVQLFVIPEKFSSYSGGTGYAIVELLDGNNEPVKADKDIHLKLGVQNPDVGINTSSDFEEIQFSNKELIIKKGMYSAYTTFTPRPNLGEFTTDTEQTFNMFISTDDYLTNGHSFTVSHDEIGALEGEGPSVTTALPFLTTGEKELIAVTYFETSVEVSRKTGSSTLGTTERETASVTVPVMAKQDYEINFASSESDSVNPINPIMKKGENVVLVFGNTGTVAPDEAVEFYITDNEGVKTMTGTPVGPTKSTISLQAEPLVPMILAGSEFPVIAYLSDGGGGTTDTGTTGGDPRSGATPFIEDSVLTLSANDFVDAEPEVIKRNQPYILFNLLAKEVGEGQLSFQAGQFEGNMAVTSHTTDPAEIHLAFAKNLLANTESLATIQLLDSAGNPVYAKKDVLIKIVSNDESVLKIPTEVTIKKGEYFNTFKLESKNEGIVELALLSEDLPLSKYDINIVDVSPVISLDLLGGMNWNERIEAKLSVAIPEIETSLDGFNVEWTTDGGKILDMKNVTNSDGVATLNILANDKDTVTVTATVSGNGLSSSTVSKTAQILNVPIGETSAETKQGFMIDSSNIIYIGIPAAIGVALFILKRTERLDAITEKLGIADKLNIGEKFEELKEKISGIRNR